MKFVSVRDLRLKPAQVWQWLHESGQLVLTSNGKPFAMMIETDEDHLDKDVMDLARIRARGALSKIRRHAQETGLDRWTDDEVEALVRESRDAAR